MGRKSRCKRHASQQAAPAPQVTDKSLRAAWMVAIGCSALVPLLVRVHTGGALAGLPFSILTSWLFWNFVSRHLCGKQFRPPSKYGPNDQSTWSDWLLLLPFIITWISVLFAFGSYADWVRGEHVWHGWW
jgi:hypothetical protein